MSCSVVFGSMIQNPTMLEKACSRMRAVGISVVGPRISGTNRLVKFPGWGHEVSYYCNKEGTVYYDSDWEGPQEHLHRLNQEYATAVAEQEVTEYGGYITGTSIDPVTGLMKVQIELPEQLSYA